MSFLSNLVNEFTHKGQSQGQGQGQPQSQGYAQQQYGGQQQQYGGGYPTQSYDNQRPNPPEPWIAEWDNQQNRWIFINRQTGQRTHDFPQSGAPQRSGYDSSPYPTQPAGYQSSGGGGYPSQPQGYNQQGGYNPAPQQQQQQKKDHSGRNTALGVAAGLAGGALLMHEGEKVEEKWDEDKYRAENRFENDKYDVENRFENDKYRVENDKYRVENDVDNFPENAARWTGNKVQEVEDIPYDVERKWDNAVQDVEDVPDDVAGWAGQKVGDVERFGDNIDDAYDAGRDDARYDDDRNDDNDGGW